MGSLFLLTSSHYKMFYETPTLFFLSLLCRFTTELQSRSQKAPLRRKLRMAIHKGYRYEADPKIFVVEGIDSIIFYNDRTKKLWLKTKNARKEADVNWETLSKEKKD